MGKHERKKEEKIVIDEAKGLVFKTEDELYEHFYKEISALEKEFFSLRDKDDVPESDFDNYEANLNAALDAPDEIWEDTETIPGTKLSIYIKKFDRIDEPHDDNTSDNGPVYHLAAVYLTDGVPSFVYLHFPTNSDALVSKYRRGTRVYDRMSEDVPHGAVAGDALSEGDDFARGLYHAMMKVRSDGDVPELKFSKYGHLREETIEQPDEIWRTNDSMGNVLVSFVKEFPDESPEGLHYVVVTLEDMPSNSHALLFAFPTTDEALLGRYRQGENLQAEEVVQEASH